MRVWSVSPYFGEHDIAEIKIHEQKRLADFHVFAEGNRDHQGNPRQPLGLGDLATLPGVRYGVADIPHDPEPWNMEGHQRASLLGLMHDLQPDDIVIVSDLDEILSARFIRMLQRKEWTLPAQFAFPIYPYRLDWRWTIPIEEGWCRCTAATGAQVLEFGTDGIVKGGKYSHVIDPQAGWHFTYQGTAEQIALKARSLADGWTAKATTLDAQRAIDFGADLFGRDRPVEPVPLDELPAYVQENRARFSHLLRGGERGQEERDEHKEEGADKREEEHAKEEKREEERAGETARHAGA